jgi:hypothetical protein
MRAWSSCGRRSRTLNSSGCGVRTRCGRASRGGEPPSQISGPCGRTKSPRSQRPTWSRSCSSSGSRSGARMAGGSGSHRPGSSRAKVVHEDLARDRLAVANAVLEFPRLRQLDADHLPPVRYRQQADGLTERYVDLVRSAMGIRGRSTPATAWHRPGPGQVHAHRPDPAPPGRRPGLSPKQRQRILTRIMVGITRRKTLNHRRHRSYPRVVKRARRDPRSASPPR